MTEKDAPLSKNLENDTPEFSRPFNLDKVSSAAPYRLSLKADPQECQKLADRIGIEAIEELSAVIMIKRERGNDLYAQADVKATVIQIDDLTLEPITESIEFDVNLHLVEGREEDENSNIDWEDELASDYDLEFYQNATVDFAEIIAQYLSLELLLPFPSSLEDLDDLDELENELRNLADSLPDSPSQNPLKKENPFTVLEKLKK